MRSCGTELRHPLSICIRLASVGRSPPPRWQLTARSKSHTVKAPTMLSHARSHGVGRRIRLSIYRSFFHLATPFRGLIQSTKAGTSSVLRQPLTERMPSSGFLFRSRRVLCCCGLGRLGCYVGGGYTRHELSRIQPIEAHFGCVRLQVLCSFGLL